MGFGSGQSYRVPRPNPSWSLCSETDEGGRVQERGFSKFRTGMFRLGVGMRGRTGFPLTVSQWRRKEQTHLPESGGVGETKGDGNRMVRVGWLDSRGSL